MAKNLEAVWIAPKKRNRYLANELDIITDSGSPGCESEDRPPFLWLTELFRGEALEQEHTKVIKHTSDLAKPLPRWRVSGKSIVRLGGRSRENAKSKFEPIKWAN